MGQSKHDTLQVPSDPEPEYGPLVLHARQRTYNVRNCSNGFACATPYLRLQCKPCYALVRFSVEGSMSQQYPGQPGGGGGGPPGYGAPFGAPPGQPGGGPPPVGAPLAAGLPYAGSPQGYPGAPPPAKKSNVWLVAGLGCGLLLLLAIGATVFALFWVRNRTKEIIGDVDRQLASASAIPGAATGRAAESSAECKSAYVCCCAIAQKTQNSAAVQACEVFKMAGYPQTSCAAALTGYRQVAKAVGASCD